MKQPDQLRFICKSQGGTVKPRTPGDLTKMVREWLPIWRSGMGKVSHRGEATSDSNEHNILSFKSEV